MKNFVRKVVARFNNGKRGFTLVELLVVVGIIVALAAVIIPNVTAFSTKGEQGAMAGEKDSVQTAMDTMMADKGITTVTANAAPSNSTNSFAGVPVEGPLGTYLRQSTTKYFYCWGTDGLITQQDKVATACP